MAEEIVDFLIIGSGSSGAAATWSLSDTSVRIMRMEQGDFMKQADYRRNIRAALHNNWKIVFALSMPLNRSKMRCGKAPVD